MAYKERGNAGNLENESPKPEAIIFYTFAYKQINK